MNRRETIDLLGRLKALCDDPARSDRVVRVLTSASLSIAIDSLNGAAGPNPRPFPLSSVLTAENAPVREKPPCP